MKSSKQLLSALAQLKAEAEQKIYSFFDNKPYKRIQFFRKLDHLAIDIDSTRYWVNEIDADGYIDITGVEPKKEDLTIENLSNISIDALLTILDQLERMKKGNQLKKP